MSPTSYNIKPLMELQFTRLLLQNGDKKKDNMQNGNP